MLTYEHRTALLLVMGAAGVLMLMPAAARADMAITDPSQIPTPRTVIDFEGLSFGEITNPDVLSAEGVRFPGAPAGDFVTLGGTPSDNKLIDVSDGMIEIEFVDPVQAAGMDYAAYPGQMLTFTAYDGVGGFIGDTTGTDAGFFGIDGDGTLIGSITVHDGVGSFNLDNLTFAHVPVPGAIALGAIGLGLVGWFRRRLS